MKATFLEELRSRDLHSLAEYSRNCPAETARAAVAKGRADSLEDLAALISPAAEAELEGMARISASITSKYFGRAMRLFAPLYVGNECVNNCVYCGFARRHDIERRTLTVPEVGRELSAIRALGFRSVLLVAGENPKLVSSGYMEEIIRLARSIMP